ncbi:MAG: PIN domain nuclease [Chloroflexi bacterium]|nr:PIN domain nuclease [Chloroflexota bacterium]
MGYPLSLRLLSAAFYGLLAAMAGAELALPTPEPWPAWVAAGTTVTGLILGFLGAPVLMTRPLRWIAGTVRSVPARSLAAGLMGLTLGLFLAFLLALPLASLPGALGRFSPLAASLTLGALGVATFAAWEHELAHAGRRLFPQLLGESTNGHIQDAGRQILVDTSAIIDGRIADISRSGFLEGSLVVPRFVLEELRHIADSSDAQRRTRGRRGLEMLTKLQQESVTPVRVLDLDPQGPGDVDDKLLLVASQLRAPIVTTDFNLNRVAELQGIRVLNVNELSNALRPPVLPGEELMAHVQQEGKEPNQGLAFLEDGTMVVIEGGRRFIGYDLDVTITRVLQTSAGRIIFSHPKDA